MLSYLEDVKDFDVLWFLPLEDDETSLRISSNVYKDAGEPVDTGAMGYTWHIMLFKTSEENDIEKLDHFEGVLMEPREYISTLIPQGWYGMVARKTTTSNKFIQDVIDTFKDL